jgi:hypothetical protein
MARATASSSTPLARSWCRRLPADAQCRPACRSLGERRHPRERLHLLRPIGAAGVRHGEDVPRPLLPQRRILLLQGTIVAVVVAIPMVVSATLGTRRVPRSRCHRRRGPLGEP